MNYKFKLNDVKVNIPQAEANIEIGSLEIEVTDLPFDQSIEFAMKLPSLITQLRRATELPIEQAGGAPIVNMEQWEKEQQASDVDA